MTLRFDFFYENADREYFLALLQKLANACDVDLHAESNAEFLSIFASAESSEILGKFANFLQSEVPHSLYFRLKEVNLCNEIRGEKIAPIARSDIFSVSDINAIKDPKNPRFCEIYANSASCGDFSRSRSPRFLDEPFVLSASLASHERENSSTILEFASCVESVKFAESNPIYHSKSLYCHSERSEESKKNPFVILSASEISQKKNNLDSSVASLPQNDNVGRDSSHYRAQNDKNKDFAESNADSALLKSTLQNLCNALSKGQSIAISTSRGEILLSTKSVDFDFILANDIATISLYTRASQDEISALASFEKPFIELTIKEVFAREVGAKSAKFILPYDIILCCLSSMLLEKDIAFVRAKIAESSAKIAESTLKSSVFFEIVVGQNGYFLHKNYMDCADFAEFLNINFGVQTSADSANIMIYLSLQNPSIFACAGRKIANIAFDKNPKNILQKISHLENGDKLIANFKKAFEARYEAISALDSAPQWTQNLLDIFECAAMILGYKADKNVIFDLAKEYLRDIGPKIDFKNVKLNSSLGADSQNLRGKPPFDSAFFSSGGLPRSHSLARNDEILDSSLASLPQNDNLNGFAESALDSADFTTNADSTLSTQEANSSIVDEFLRSCEASDADRTDGSSRSEMKREREKSPQDAEFAFYDELRTIRSVISFTLAGTEREVVAFGILESLADYLVLLFREAQNQFGAKNICIAGDMFANKVFFDKITKKVPTNFKLIFPKYLDISSARRASCKT